MRKVVLLVSALFASYAWADSPRQTTVAELVAWAEAELPRVEAWQSQSYVLVAQSGGRKAVYHSGSRYIRVEQRGRWASLALDSRTFRQHSPYGPEDFGIAPLMRRLVALGREHRDVPVTVDHTMLDGRPVTRATVHGQQTVVVWIDDRLAVPVRVDAPGESAWYRNLVVQEGNG